jgi:hypothetical protein
MAAVDADDVPEAIVAELRRLAERVRAARADLGEYTIVKSLTRDPSGYKDASSQPHVQIALRMRAARQPVRAGDVIPYVIATSTFDAAADKAAALGKPVAGRVANATGLSTLAAVAFSADEMKFFTREAPQAGVAIDADWYLSNQVFPCVQRLCEHITGLTSALLCEALQLDQLQKVFAAQDAANQARRAAQDGAAGAAGAGTGASAAAVFRPFRVAFKGQTLEETYYLAERVHIRCRGCQQSYPVDTHERIKRIAAAAASAGTTDLLPFSLPLGMMPAFKKRYADPVCSRIPFVVCPNPGCRNPVASAGVVANTVQVMLRNALRRFYECGATEDEMLKLRHQVDYLRHLFDEPALSSESAQERNAWRRVTRFADADGAPCCVADVAQAVRSAVAAAARRVADADAAGGGAVKDEAEDELEKNYMAFNDPDAAARVAASTEGSGGAAFVDPKLWDVDLDAPTASNAALVESIRGRYACPALDVIRAFMPFVPGERIQWDAVDLL